MNIKEKIHSFQESFNPYFHEAIEKVLEEQVSFSKIPTDIDDLVKTSINQYSSTGKRIRPYIITELSELDLKDQAVLNASLSYELFHLMALIHDDIIDASSVRRGVPTIHSALKGEAKEHQAFGRDIAILLGDAFLIESLRYAMLLTHERYEDITRILQQTIRGQFLDVCGMNEAYGETSHEVVLARETLKTAWYTFAGPAELGLNLREHPLPESEITKITDVYLELGKLFQMRDDIIDCDQNRTDKRPFEDIYDGQTTWVTLLLKEQYPEIFIKISQLRKRNEHQKITDLFTDIDLLTPYQREYQLAQKQVEILKDIDRSSYDTASDLLAFMEL